MAAISATDTALWDIKGKYFNVPLYVLLGGKHRNKLHSYASQLQNGWKYHDFQTAPGDLQFLKDTCQAAVADGYDTIKIDFLGQRLDSTPISRNEMQNYLTKDTLKDFVARVKTAREAVGPDVHIIMENHCLTSANTAIQFVNAVKGYDFMLLEEPASSLSPLEY